MNKTAALQQGKAATLFSRAQGILQRSCASCGHHEVAGVECAECAKKKRSLQRKLAIGSSNDPLEHEADRIADQVLATPSHPAVGSAPPRIMRYTGQAAAQTDAAPASVDRVLASPGRPLEPSIRLEMEQRFGRDFSQVRVHSGAAAEKSAQEVSASAYTVGHDLVFGAGRFAPGTHEGRRLIAHELTHVVQQSGAGEGLLRRKILDSTGEADKGGLNGLLRPRPLPRPCAAWEDRRSAFIREIAGQYLKEEIRGYGKGVISSVDCGDFGDDCTVNFDVPTGFSAHVKRHHEPEYVSVEALGRTTVPKTIYYSYECKGPSSEVVLTRRETPKASEPAPTPLPIPPDPIPEPTKHGTPVEVTVKAAVETEESKDKGEKKQEESRKVSVEVVVPIPKIELGKDSIWRAPLVFFGKLNLEASGGAKSESPGKPGEPSTPHAFGEFKPSVQIVGIEKERIPVPLRPTVGFDLAAVGSVELKKKGFSFEGGGEANLQLKIPLSPSPFFFFGKGTGSWLCGKEPGEDGKCLFKWGVGVGIGGTFGGEHKK